MKDYDNFFPPSNDLKKGNAFYQNLLGLPVKFDLSVMGMVAFKVGNNEPAIILKDKQSFHRRRHQSGSWLIVCGKGTKPER